MRRARAQFVICACHFSLGHDREALRALEEATREGDLPPDGAYQVYQLAVRHFTSQGRWAQALDACARAEQAPGLGSRARLLRADAEWQRGEYGRAARAVEQGLALEPAERVRVELFLQRALVERELGRLDAALNLLQEAEAVPTPAPLDDVNIERGWTLAMRGQADEALEALAERLRVNTHAARMKLLREIGTLSFLRGHLNRAHDCFQQVLLNLPRSSVGMRLACALDLGLALLALGEEARAREQFQEAAANPARALSKTLAQRFLDWREGEPLPEPPEPGRDCAWMQRPLYFYYLGEFAYLSRRREEAVRGLHRAVIEAPSPYRHAAWMAALRLGQLGETVPGGAPSFVPLE
ncbi:MAG: tetratricopeptide repeat protein [Planctomycetota bacterium]|nr:tetratricopeptide repeat protein [Planctomycetota bacterium]